MVLFVDFLCLRQIAIEPFAVFHHSVLDYMCFTVIFTDEVNDPYADRIVSHEHFQTNSVKPLFFIFFSPEFSKGPAFNLFHVFLYHGIVNGEILSCPSRVMSLGWRQIFHFTSILCAKVNAF